MSASPTAGKIIIITAPSGSGKTTLVKRLLQSCPQLSFSVSACTRQPRDAEQHSKDYYFYTEEQFNQLIAEDAFVEWEMVYPGKYYGTLKSELQRIWDSGHCPVVDIDVHGAINIQNKYPANTFSVFIQAPSLDILRNRLQSRGTETEKSLEERVKKADYELGFSSQFNKVIVNDDLNIAAKKLQVAVEGFLL